MLCAIPWQSFSYTFQCEDRASDHIWKWSGQNVAVSNHLKLRFMKIHGSCPRITQRYYSCQEATSHHHRQTPSRVEKNNIHHMPNVAKHSIHVSTLRHMTGINKKTLCSCIGSFVLSSWLQAVTVLQQVFSLLDEQFCSSPQGAAWVF